jgi:hypothetical protein
MSPVPESALTRLDFLAALATAGTAVLLPGRLGGQEPPAPPKVDPKTAIPDRGPRLDLELVREFVVAAHGNLEKTTELLDRQPALVNATHDWGGGDWETALGGASHMGRADIARFLLSRGARKDVFCAAMLGELALVRAFLEADPATVRLKGPHGIPLLVHAQKGKQEAVEAFLREKAS